MIQKIRKIFLAALLCLSTVLLFPSSSYAAASAAELSAVQQNAEDNLKAVVELDDVTLQKYIEQFNAQNYTTLASGLQSWLDLKSEIGGFVSIDSTEVEESEDGYLVIMQISCAGQRTATVHIEFQKKDGSISRISFDKNETLQEKLVSAGLNLLIGMGTVFIVLIFIAFLISRFKYINRWVTAKEEEEKEEKAYQAAVAAAKKLPGSATDVSKRISPEAVRAAMIPAGTKAELIAGDAENGLQDETAEDAQMVAVLAAAVAAAQEPDPQLIAVITAAVMAIQAEQGEDPGPDGLVVRSIRRVSVRGRRR